MGDRLDEYLTEVTRLAAETKNGIIDPTSEAVRRATAALVKRGRQVLRSRETDRNELGSHRWDTDIITSNQTYLDHNLAQAADLQTLANDPDNHETIVLGRE